MAVFVTNIKFLRLVKQHEIDEVIRGVVVKQQQEAIEFGEKGRYETDDKSEIKFLREHSANQMNPKHTNVKFWEFNPPPNAYGIVTAEEPKKSKKSQKEAISTS